MTVQEKTNISTRELTRLPNNPRKITQHDLNILCDSLRLNGFYPHRPLAVERQDDGSLIVLDGNQRLKAARRLKMKEVPCVIYEGLTDDERTEIIMRGNINNGTWDTDLLQSDFSGVDYEAIGLNIELPASLELEQDSHSDKEHDPEQAEPDKEQDPDEDSEQDMERLSFYQRLLGDYVYPSEIGRVHV